MKATPSFILLVLLVVVGVKAQMPVIEENKKDKLEQRVLSMVKNLPEVRAFFKDCPKENEPALLVNGVPDSTFKYYWISIGIGNFGQFRTTFHLYINPHSMRIYYLDFFDESGMGVLPIETWRKWRKKPGFQKIHIFRGCLKTII